MITIPISDINNNPSLVPKPNFGTYVEGDNYNFFETQEEADSFYANLSVPEEVIEVMAWQLWIYLDEIGLLGNIDTFIQNIEDPVLKNRAIKAREYVVTIKTDSPFIQLVAQEMNITKEQMKNIFLTAKEIEL